MPVQHLLPSTSRLTGSDKVKGAPARGSTQCPRGRSSPRGPQGSPRLAPAAVFRECTHVPFLSLLLVP